MSLSFHVESGDGRRSSEWVITVSGKRQADVYLAPHSLFPNIKASLHESGYCQIGPTAGLRDKVSWQFRSAMARWNHDRQASVPQPAVLIRFRQDQLVTTASSPRETSRALTLPDGQDLVVGVFLSPFNLPDGVGYIPIASRELGDGTTLTVAAAADEPAGIGRLLELGPNFGVLYPQPLTEFEFGYGVAGVEANVWSIHELAASTIVEQDWGRVGYEELDVGASTSEEYAMSRIESAKTLAQNASEYLASEGPRWGSEVAFEGASILTDLVTSSMEAMLTIDSIARQEGLDLGTEGDPTVAAFVQYVRQLGTVCDDPDCPEHRVRPPST